MAAPPRMRRTASKPPEESRRPEPLGARSTLYSGSGVLSIYLTKRRVGRIVRICLLREATAEHPSTDDLEEVRGDGVRSEPAPAGPLRAPVACPRPGRPGPTGHWRVGDFDRRPGRPIVYPGCGRGLGLGRGTGEVPAWPVRLERRGGSAVGSVRRSGDAPSRQVPPGRPGPLSLPRVSGPGVASPARPAVASQPRSRL